MDRGILQRARDGRMSVAVLSAWMASVVVLLVVLAAQSADARPAAPTTGATRAKAPTTIACDRIVVLRRGTVRSLRRAGFRAAGRSSFTRRTGRSTERVCIRRAASPRWVSRGLGRPLATGRGQRAQRSVSAIDFPATLNGPLKLDLPEGLGTSGWRMLDVPAARADAFQGGVRYETTAFDVVVESGYGSVKESIVVHERQGIRTWRWRLTYTKGTKPYIDGEGRIAYGGKVLLAAPVVFNASNRVVRRPAWKLDGNVASFTVNDRRLALPYVVDPTADFPQRIYPMSTANATVAGSENVSLATGATSSCTKLPIDAVGESIWGSMIARDASPGGAIATATPSGGPNGWAIQDGTAASGTRIYALEAADDQTIYAAGELGYVLRSLDGGCSWTRHWTGTMSVLRGISAPSPSVVWVAGENGAVRRSTNANGAATFAAADAGVPNSTLNDIDALDANIAMIGGVNKYVGYTSNGGGTWTTKNESNMGDVWAVDLVGTAGSPPYPGWVVTSPSKVYRADNMNGTTNPQIGWKFQNVADFRSISAVNGDIAWAVGAGGAIYKTTNGSASSGAWLWAQQAVGLTGQQLNWVKAVDASTVFAAGAGGTIAYTSNGGTSWSLQPNASGGNEIVSGTARSANLAWVGDASGRIQRLYPSGAVGSYGWTSATNGGTTLSAGPWTIGARVCRETFSTGSIDVGFRARVWKIRTAAGAVTSSTPMTGWTAASPQTSLAAGACYSPTVTATPASTSMLPTEHFYVEYALKVYNNSRAYETISLATGHADTYIDFGTAAADSTPPPTNLRHSSFMGPSGYTGDTTPTLRADLNDPDWYHHIRYQICADALCTTIVAQGTSAAGQLLGSTTDSWTAPLLPEGFYYMRARTEEDGGEADQSAWTPIDPNPAVNLCAGTNLGPCDKFGIDTGPPSAPGSPADGPAADIAYTASGSQLTANWTAATDGAGILNYEYCIGTATAGGATTCAGTIVQAWATTGSNALDHTRTGLALTNGQIYYTCVRAIDLAGNAGPSVCTNGQVVDTAAPPQTAAVRDGAAADLAYTANTTQLQANWDAVTDVAGGSGLARYDACFSTSNTGADCAGAAASPWASTGTTTNALRTGLALSNGTTYFSCVRAVDAVGNIGLTRCSNGIIVDTAAPTATWTSWTENSAYLYSPGGANANLLWYNPAAPLEAGRYARGTVTATDGASGMQRVDFPALGAGAAWGPGGSDTVVTAPDLWTWDYTFTGGGAIGDPALANATAFDVAGNSIGAPALNFRIEPDATSPTSPATVPLMSGLQNTTSYAQSIPLGTDADSGVGRYVMDVQFAPLYDNACGAWDPWIDGTLIAGYSGAASNGMTLNVTHFLNDPDLNLVPDYNDAFCFRTRVRVFDNVENVTTIADNGFTKFDFGRPEVAFSGPPAGSAQTGTFNISGTAEDVWAGGGFEYVDTGSGMNQVVVSWEAPDGPDADALPDASGTACTITTFGGPWTAHTWACAWNSAAPAIDGIYTIRIQGRDRAGNLSTIQTRTYLIDNVAPARAWHSWNDNGSAWMHAVGNVAWANPTAPAGAYQLDARVTATDAGSGVNRVEFPGLGAGWTPAAGITNATFTSPVPVANAYTMSYTFANPAALTPPGALVATAFDGAGNNGTVPFEVRLDGLDPTGMDATVVDGLQSTATVAVTLTNGSEGALESGLASWLLEYETAPLANDTCGAWSGSWTSVASGAGLAPATYSHDVTALGSQCYRYRLSSIDNVGNVGTSTPTTARRVDRVIPVVDITSPAHLSAQSATFSIGGTATDAHSGIDHVRLTWTGPEAPGTGVICDPATLGGASPAWTFSCSWNTITFDDGWYTITATSYDRAGNVSMTDSIDVLVDNQAPVRAWHSWNDYGSVYMHSVGNVAWVNPTAPAGAYQLDARVTATDAGSGVNRVEFPGLGAGWTPAAGITNATNTSPVPVANAWTMAYTFATPGAITATGVVNATAFDGAGNNGTVPFEVRRDGIAPTGMTATVANGRQTTGLVNVTLGGGTDGALESGLRSWALLVDTSPLVDDVCTGWTNGWGVIAAGVGIAPAGYVHDVTLDGSQCYRYRIEVTDNVGNVGVSTPATAQRVDMVAPTVAITSPATGTTQGGTFTVAGTASDAHTGIDHVRLTWTGPEAPGTGIICDPATLGGASPAWTFSCPWNTVAPIAFDDGTYTLTATSYDRAGNVSAVSNITVILDNFPPFIGFHSFNETSPYTYWAGPIGTNTQLWYNPSAPAASYSFDVLVDASDPSGINRVEYAAAGAGWTGGLPATQTVPVGPATRYAQTYSFNTAGAVADPPALAVTAFDAANNPAATAFDLAPDSAIPTGGSVTNTNGFVGSTTVVVNVASGGDGAGSGIQGWTLLRDTGTLSGGACIGWTGYTTTVATGVGPVAGTRNDTVADPSCSRYRLVVTDNVGNVATYTGTDETRVDLTPPTGTLALTEGSNPQWQYLDTSTRLFVNTGPGRSGTFVATVNAAAASGILDVAFPPLAAGFTGNGTMPGPGPSFPNTYSWTPGAGAPAAVNAVVRSNSLGSLNLPFEVIADATAPTGATVTHVSGFTTSTTLGITYTAGNDGTGSGIAGHQLERQVGTLAAGACTWAGAWLAIGPAGGGAYTDNSLVHAECYRYRVAVTDNVGNVGYSPISTPRMVDTTAPVGGTVTLAEGSNPNEQYLAAADTIWLKAAPTAASNFTITVTANDPESGTGAAVFPGLGSTLVFTSSGPFSGSYAWTPTVTAPVAPTVQVANGSGLTTNIPFTVNVDGTAPSGATLDQENGFVTNFSVDLSYAGGADAGGSGIGTWRIERQSAPYSIGPDTCAPWGLYATYPMPTGQPASPYVDTGVVQPTCYRYRLVEIDRVGNRTDTLDASGDVAKVISDVFPPADFDLNLPTNPAIPAITTGQPAPACGAVPTWATATPAMTWTPSSDAESGLSHYEVFVDGVGTVDATVPAGTETWTPPALTDGTHTLGVRALDFLANFKNAAPAFPSSFQVDVAPPTGSLNAPAAGSWSGDTTPTLDWNATDATCLARVEVYLDGAGAPAAVASGSEGSWTPAAPLADGAHTWRFVAWDVAGHSSSFGPYAFGIDTVQPTPFAITAPTAGQTVRGFVNVSWTASTDVDSGLSPASGYRIYVDGILRGTVSSATLATTITGITAGPHSIVVRATDLVGNTRDTAAVMITGYGAILPPALVSPADLAAVNAVPLLDWNWGSDGGPPPTDYDVYLDTVAVANVVHPTSQYTPGALADGNHTWRIEQHDPYTGTVTTATRTFLLDRTAPNNPGPLSRIGTVQSWPAATDPAAPVASGIDRIEFWIDPAGAPPATFTTHAAGTTSRDYGTLPDGIYTMWVRAYDRAGNFTDSPADVVTNDSVPPTAFNLDAPAALPAVPAITHGPVTPPTCQSAATYTSATPTLSWQPSSDATSGLAGYDVYVDNALVTSVGAGTTSHTLVAPLAGGAHTWHVVARDNFGLTRASTPNPMNVRIDAVAPTVAYGAPANNSYTADTTPNFSWTAGDDNCVARVELTVGGNVYVFAGGETSFAPAVVLPEGPTTWSLRAFDSAGRITSAGAPRTINIDTTAPTGITATFPANGATENEGMLTFDWSDGTDAGSGIDHYDIIVDGTPGASGLAASTHGTYQILGGAVIGTTAPHNWSIRVYDAVGNSAVFPFNFLARSVPDTTPPNPFNLLTPADNASVPAGTALTWQAAWDFKGVTQYRVYIDGNLMGTTAGNVTTFTPAAGTGSPICTVDYDPGLSAGCIAGPSYSSGTVATPAPPPATGGAWNTTTAAGWSAAGNAFGIGDQSLSIAQPNPNPGAGFDGDRAWTAAEYQTSIPAGGGDIRVEHRYNLHMNGLVAHDGATIELMVDTAGNGFGDDAWEPTCEFGTIAIYGTSVRCKGEYEIIENSGGYNVVMGGANAASHPIYKQNAFSGNSGGIVQTKLRMANFAGKNVKIRFRIGMDACFTDMATAPAPYPDYAALCDDTESGMGAPGYFPAQWRIDNVTLANSSLLPGPHTWRVQARDAAGNFTWSNQTWTFNLL